ncbi:MAG TPA: helix-turn-helix domain-containing protein [Tepidisphaeraceae bacterium]|nr:helix-turn-helix domain-containing protein [Tepidisphaeraceae bacterium]
MTLVPPGPMMARQSSRAIAAADDVVAEALLFLEQNLERGVDITELSRALGLSRRSLEMRFKSALGRTPGQELARLKIDRAQILLATTSLPLKKIAVLSGFGTQVQMSHVFRRSSGQTPLGYRRGFLPH